MNNDTATIKILRKVGYYILIFAMCGVVATLVRVDLDELAAKGKLLFAAI